MFFKINNKRLELTRENDKIKTFFSATVGSVCRVAKSTVVVIDVLSVQNLLVPFCCAFENDTLQHFLLLDDLGQQL